MSDNLKTYPERVEYIRADIVKEREAKLIQAALDFPYDHDVKHVEIYQEAGLEELK